MEIIVSIESVKNAEKKGGCQRAYLARLATSLRGSIDRQFAPKLKELNERNRRAFRLGGKAGDVFEARRWWWDDERGSYVGGTCWFGVQADGSIFPLTRDEAFAAVLAPRLSNQPDAADLLAIQRPARMELNRVYSRSIKEVDEADNVHAIEHCRDA